jgi:hypothetical protein
MELTYGTPKKLPDGRYYVKVSKPDDSRVMIQLNKVKLLTKFDESDDVTLELNQAALEKISSVDAQNVAASKVNSQTWFGKVLADQTLDAAYSKSTQDASMNTTKAKVTKIFAHDKSPIDPGSVDSGLTCDVILEFAGIWFLKKTFGPVWRIAQVRLLAPPKKSYPDEYLFQDDESNEVDLEADDDYI